MAFACVQCGDPVTRSGRISREYCSDRCYIVRKRFLRINPTEPTCVLCAKPFARGSNRQKFCVICRDTARLTYSRDYHRSNLEAERKAARENAREAKKREPGIVRARDRAYRKRNRKKIAAKRKTDQARRAAAAYMRKSYRDNPRRAIHMRMASAVYQALRQRKSGRRWESLVGYTLDDLMIHLQRSFKPGMSWANMGEWHIDHVVPRAAFTYANADDDGFQACWALTNLQPLWAAENQQKHDARVYLI